MRDVILLRLSGIRQSEIAVNKGIPGNIGGAFHRKTLVTEGQNITKFDQLPPRIFCRIRLLSSVVQVDLDLSPSRMAVLRQHLDETLVILLGRGKI